MTQAELKKLNESLEIITPIRGRKPISSRIFTKSSLFRNNNPDKGTETKRKCLRKYLKNSLEIITPIRGRKHISVFCNYVFHICLEIITPIRGRKPVSSSRLSLSASMGLEIITPIRGRKRLSTHCLRNSQPLV